MNPPTQGNEKFERAIAAISRMREIHRKWLVWIDGGHATSKELNIAGDREMHARCVADYDLILDVLTEGRRRA